MSEKRKVLLVTNIPTPYRVPLFNEINRQLNDCGIRFKVVFGALGYPRRHWNINIDEFNFDYKILPRAKLDIAGDDRAFFTYKNLIEFINEEKPNVIITNGFSIATLKIWYLSLIKNIKYIIWSGDINTIGRKISKLRHLQRIILSRRASGFIAYGTKALEYLTTLGINKDKIIIGINTVDTRYFLNVIKKTESSNGQKKNLLYIGNLAKGKRIDQLLQIVKRISLSRDDFQLKIIGIGPEEKDLKKQVNDLKINDYVKFEGYKQKDQLPHYLSVADIFVFPSEYDIWGLVLVEAMATGTVCISSIHAGAPNDLILDGENGFSVDFRNTEKVFEIINWIFTNPEKAVVIGKNARTYIENNVSLKISASAFVRMTRAVFLGQK